MSWGRVRLKFCGMTNPEDAYEASRLGVDAIGLIFHAPSARNVTIHQAQQIAAILPPFVAKVGVFVDQPPEVVVAISEQVPLDFLQFHGHETAEYCRLFRKPYIKVIAVGQESVLATVEEAYPDAVALLFDTYKNDVPGGSGESFNWDNLPTALTKPVILAGGLCCDNLEDALRLVHPYAIDVTSGVERSKGRKDPIKMKFFVDTVMDYYKAS